jgi:hypothetical protein
MPCDYPHQLLEKLAKKIWRRIRDASEYGISQGEVGMTDYLLLEIVRSETPAIKVLKTNPRQEASQGTDWEWWIGPAASGWICCAIQAKKLAFWA